MPQRPNIQPPPRLASTCTSCLAALLLLLLPIAASRAECPASVPASLPHSGSTLALSATTEAGAEIRECMGTNLVIRNVEQPTLTPVLPQEGERNGAAVIVVPGGGFEMLSMTEEGYAVAQWLADKGIAAFVLKYRLKKTPVSTEEWRRASAARMRALAHDNGDAPRLPTLPEAIEDAAAAVRLVRKNAAQWGIDPERVGMLGFSAGAMTSIAAGDQDDAAVRPDFIAPIYPPMWPREIPAHAPPMFLAIALDDDLFTSGGRPLDYLNDWQASGKPFEAHLFQSGGHGFGLTGNGAASALWAEAFYAWLQDRGLLVAGSGYTVTATPISVLLDDPEARAILEKHLPALVENTQLQMAASLSLEKLAGFAPELIDRQKLGQIQQALDGL